jgi:hypothetical protein
MMNSNYTITTYKSLARVPPHSTTTSDNTRQGSFTSHAYSSGFWQKPHILSFSLILSLSLCLCLSLSDTDYTTHSHLKILRKLSFQQQPQLRTRKVQSIFFLCRNAFFSPKREQHDGWHTNLGTTRQSSQKKTNKQTDTSSSSKTRSAPRKRLPTHSHQILQPTTSFAICTKPTFHRPKHSHTHTHTHTLSLSLSLSLSLKFGKTLSRHQNFNRLNSVSVSFYFGD